MQLTLIADIEAVAIHGQQLAMGYEIRPLQENDLPELAELYLAAYPREIVKDLAAAKDEMQRTFVGEYGQLVAQFSPVAVTRGMVVGTVLTVAQAPWPDTPEGLFVIEVITHPHHRRRGLAKAGVWWAATRAQKQGFSTLALRVESENSGAVALYRELGFREWLP
jgi:ribosomal protein S18 acetylase RimI-like enzyme